MSILLGKEVGKLLVSNGLLYRQQCTYLTIKVVWCRDLLVGMPMSRLLLYEKTVVKPNYL